MHFINTRRLFFDVSRSAAGFIGARWGFWHWQGCVFWNAGQRGVHWMRYDGDAFLAVGSLIFGFSGLDGRLENRGRGRLQASTRSHFSLGITDREIADDH